MIVKDIVACSGVNSEYGEPKAILAVPGNWPGETFEFPFPNLPEDIQEGIKKFFEDGGIPERVSEDYYFIAKIDLTAERLEDLNMHDYEKIEQLTSEDVETFDAELRDFRGPSR